MSRVLDQFQRIELPPHQQRALGLAKDWQQRVSREFAKVVLTTARKHKDVLRELKKY